MIQRGIASGLIKYLSNKLFKMLLLIFQTWLDGKILLFEQKKLISPFLERIIRETAITKKVSMS